MSNSIWWLDTETTGLEPGVNGIVEIACIITSDVQTDPHTIQGAKQYEALVDPGDVVYSERALEVNGLTVEDIKSRRPIKEALLEMDRQVKFRDIIAGWNVSGFDIPMLKAAYKEAGIKWRFSHHCIDLMVVANYMKYIGLLNVKSLGLQAMASHYGFLEGQFGPAHRALPDVKLTMAVGAMMRQTLIGDTSYGF